jgi:hypothetical protein
VTALIVALALLQNPPCSGDAARHAADAARRGQAFDLDGAAAAYAAAVHAGCGSAQAPLIYVRGLLAAHAAGAQFGAAASLQPLKQAVTDLQPFAASDPVARTMQTVLRAAMPAAQRERAEMTLFIDEMLRMESLQLEAKQPPLPVLSAHEAAGQFWLQLRLYDEARRAFDAAAQRVGPTPHGMLGAARAAAGLKDLAAACDQYRRLIAWWADRVGSPPEIVEAQSFLKQPSCAKPAPRTAR